MEDWDAVWFGSRSLPENPIFGDMPGSRSGSLRLFNVENCIARSARQRYIFWEIESPAYLYTFNPHNYKHFFNWTISFRQDSSVELPYGGVRQTRDHPEGEELNQLIRKFGEENSGLAVRKTPAQDSKAKVAWMVSNCLTESNREGFVEDLRKHIDIDIYGNCYKGENRTT